MSFTPQHGAPVESSPTPLLAARGLHSRFGGPFEFALQAGECVAIQGPSGAGKSVLLRMLADLDPHEGEVLLDGRSNKAMPAPAWRAQVVYQAAEPAWWEATGGEHFTDAQRGFVEKSLAAGPRVLLLDEPTAALDPDSVKRAEALLASCLADGMAIIIVTHSGDQAQRLAQRVFRLDQGRLSTT